MSFFSGLFRQEKKASPGVAFVNLPTAISAPRDYESFSKEGYQKCVVGYRCIRIISTNCSKVPLILYKKSRDGTIDEIQEHPLIELINKPNPMMDWSLFFENVLGFLNISGNAFIKAVQPSPSRPPLELWAMRPDRMKIIPGIGGMPAGYEYKVQNHTETFSVDALGRSNMVHMKLFNPVDDWYGMSPIEAAAINIDICNSISTNNLSLLKNQARPSGVIKLLQDDRNSGRLTPERRTELQNKLEANWSGVHNSGRPVILEGGMEWQQTGLSPRDMDFYNSSKISKTDVALAYGIPAQLVGVEGSQTFANYEHALLTLYDEVVIPQIKFMLGHINRWLVPMFKDDSLFFDYDEDKIGALEPRRASRRAALVQVTWLTPNEKRQLEGWGKYEEGDEPGDQILISGGLMPLSSALEPVYEEEEDEENGASNPDLGAIDYDDDDDDDDDDTEDNDGKSNKKSLVHTSAESGFEFELKAFNIRSERGKQLYRAAFLQKMKVHEKRLAKKLSKHWNYEGKRVVDVMKSTHQDVWDYAIGKILTEQMPILEKTLSQSLLAVSTDFGESTLRGFKSYKAGHDTKDALSYLTSQVNIFVAGRASKLAQSLTRTTKKTLTKKIEKTLRDELQESVAEGVMISTSAPDVVGTVFKSFERSRAGIVAENEAHIAACESTLAAAEALEVPGMQKGWVSALDDRTRREEPNLKNWADHVTMNGVVVGLEDMFEVPSSHGTDLLKCPGDADAPLNQICNCRCAIMFPIIEG